MGQNFLSGTFVKKSIMINCTETKNDIFRILCSLEIELKKRFPPYEKVYDKILRHISLTALINKYARSLLTYSKGCCVIITPLYPGQGRNVVEYPVVGSNPPSTLRHILILKKDYIWRFFETVRLFHFPSIQLPQKFCS